VVVGGSSVAIAVDAVLLSSRPDHLVNVQVGLGVERKPKGEVRDRGAARASHLGGGLAQWERAGSARRRGRKS